MAPPQPTLLMIDVVGVLLDAMQGDADVDGWQIMRAVRRAGPTVYSALDALEDAGWVTSEWERRPPSDSRPRRRFYRLTAVGVEAARDEGVARQQAPRLRRLRPHPGLGFLGLASR
jgi:DNA-binding PadR family transcriptional regulator